MRSPLTKLILFVGAPLVSAAPSQLRKIARDAPPPLECTHVDLEQWASADLVAYRTDCGEIVDSLYAASKDNLTIVYENPNSAIRVVNSTVLPQYHNEGTCTVTVNSASADAAFVAQITAADLFIAAYEVWRSCSSEDTAAPGTFGGTQYFYSGNLSLTVSYTPNPGIVTDTSVSLTAMDGSLKLVYKEMN